MRARRDHLCGRRGGARRLTSTETDREGTADGDDDRHTAELHRRRARRLARARREPVLNPATGEELARAPTVERRGRRPRGEGRAARVRGLVADDARPARAGAARARRPGRGARRGARAPGGAQRGQADRSGHGRRDPRDGRQPALLRRRRALPGGPGGGRVHGGLHLLHAPRGGRRDRAGDAVELPADDGDLEIRAGARGGQHGRAEAGRDDADHDACASPSWRRTSCRRAC